MIVWLIVARPFPKMVDVVISVFAELMLLGVEALFVFYLHRSIYDENSEDVAWAVIILCAGTLSVLFGKVFIDMGLLVR
jgi:hypothetical protein